jgi:hypothetical protein
MTRLTQAEIEGLKTVQSTISKFRRAHTMDLSSEDLRLISEIFTDTNLLLKRYSDALPGGF